jgi:hypothetical protein
MAACLVRLGVAVAEYRAVAAVPEAWKQGWDRGFARGSKGRPPPEGLKEMGSAFATVGQTLIVATVAGQAFFVSGYWGVVAFVFTRKNKASAAPVVVP